MPTRSLPSGARLSLLLPASLLLFGSTSCVGTLTIGADPGGSGDDDDAIDENDRDGDGDPADTDCDDEDDEVAHGLDEVCGDEKDNDCDPDTRCYEVRKDGDSGFIEPIEGNEDGVAFYGYESAGGTHGLELSDSLVTALYRDRGNGELFLLVVVDGEEDGSGGFLALEARDIGSAELLLVDDPGEGFEDGGSIFLQLQWASCCTDGAVIGPLDSDFCVEFDVVEAEGLGGGHFTYDGNRAVSVDASVRGVSTMCVVD